MPHGSPKENVLLLCYGAAEEHITESTAHHTESTSQFILPAVTS